MTYDELPGWLDLSEQDREIMSTFHDSFSLKDGTRLTSDIFGQGEMLGLEMYTLSRMAISRFMDKKK